MNAIDFRYGFRVLGPLIGERRLVDTNAAFAGYADCDERAEVERESYLSAFTFGPDFRDHLRENGTSKGFTGPCWARWIWFDIDREEDLDGAKEAARRLATALAVRFGVEGELLIFFSGSKGFHLGIPTALWVPSPSPDFHRAARRFAENAAALQGVEIDRGVYDRVRAFRAPNSRHAKTGLHKRRLAFDSLMQLSTAGILELAARPEPFEIPDVRRLSGEAAADWADAEDQIASERAAMFQGRGSGADATRLNRRTLDFIRDGATNGERARRLFSAAANLAEFSCPPALAHALLTEAALDSGLPPGEARRQIDCGLQSLGQGGGHE